MKVYVIKSKQTKEYQTVVMDFIPDIRQSDIFIDYEVALAYCPSDCEVVECELMEKTELTDYTKQVRKEVCEEIRNWCDKSFNWVGDGTGYDGQDYNEMIGSNNTINKLRELLDQIEQGETKCK